MRAPLTLAAIVFAAAALGAGCGDDSGDEPATSAAATSTETTTAEETTSRESKPEPPPPPGTEVKLAGSQFGDILFDADDQAIYLFDLEGSDKSECYGECAAAWPPVLTDGEPVAGKGIDAKLLGTTERDDGKTQVTYNGHPLYYYAHEGPGQVLCHNVFEYGGLWLVVTAQGEAAPA